MSQKFATVDSKYFKKNNWKLSTSDDAGLGSILGGQRARQRGVIAASRMAVFTTNPTVADTVTIGGAVFEFCAPASPLVPLDPTHVAVARGGSAAISLANLINAINLVTDAVNILYPSGYSQFNAPAVKADSPSGTVLRIRNATMAGSNGVVVPGAGPSLALSQSITAGAGTQIWAPTNLNLSAGKDLTDQDYSLIKRTITAQDVTDLTVIVELPFKPSAIIGDTTAQAAVSIGGPTTLAAPTDQACTAGLGTLPAGTWYYKITGLNANGETTASGERSQVLAAAGGVNVNWSALAGATGYKIYRGSASGQEVFLAEVGAVTTYLDAGGDVPDASVTPPTVNTTGGDGGTLTIAMFDAQNNPFYAANDVAAFLAVK